MSDTQILIPVPKKPAGLIEQKWEPHLLRELLGERRTWWYAYLTWDDVIAACGPLPPDVKEPRERGVFDDYRARNRFYRFRRSLYTRLPLAALVYSDGFGVAPKEWPDELLPLFPTDSPPSPYDVVCRLMADHRAFGAEKLIPRHEYAFLMWWLVGTPMAALEYIDPEARNHVVGAVKSLLRGSHFFLWALGDDLMPIRINPKQDAWIRRALQLPDRLILDRVLWPWERDLVLQSAYVRGILLSRRANRPMTRLGPVFRGVFHTLEEKIGRILASPYCSSWFFTQRARIRALKYRPEWAIYTLSLEEAYVEAYKSASSDSSGDSVAKTARRLAAAGSNPKPRRRDRRNRADDQGVLRGGHPSGAVEGDPAVDGAALHVGIGQEPDVGDSGEPDHAADRA